MASLATMAPARTVVSAPGSQLGEERRDGRVVGGCGVDHPPACSSWLMRMLQNFGPHIEQKWACLAPSAGSVSSW